MGKQENFLTAVVNWFGHNMHNCAAVKWCSLVTTCFDNSPAFSSSTFPSTMADMHVCLLPSVHTSNDLLWISNNL